MINRFYNDINQAWKTLWPSPVFRAHVFLTFSIFAAVTYYCTMYLSIWETRRGTILLDPLLNMLPPKDFSLPIFILVYAGFIVSTILNLASPKIILKGFQAYGLLLLVRTVCIYMVPLEAPLGMIYLEDPFSALLLNNVNVVTKDLFFSGHISAMCLFVYFSRNKYWKTFLLVSAPVLAGLLLWQHVHYTVDIIAAPFFAYISCKAIDIVNERWEYGIDKIGYSRRNYQR